MQLLEQMYQRLSSVRDADLRKMRRYADLLLTVLHWMKMDDARKSTFCGRDDFLEFLGKFAKTAKMYSDPEEKFRKLAELIRKHCPKEGEMQE